MTRQAQRILIAVVVVLAAGCGNDDDALEAPVDEQPPQQITPAPETPEPDEVDEGDDEAVESQTYTVESGDTLSGIAQRFDTTVDALVEANDLDDPDRLSIGQELVIPAGAAD